MPHAGNAVYYAEIVRDKSTLRALIHSSTDILRDAYDESGDAREMLAQAEQKIFAILGANGTGKIESISDILHSAMERIDSRMKNTHMTGGIETGFIDLDNLTGGLHNSELVILAARPSMGKTALAMNIAEHTSVELNISTLFVSLEMSSLELADRLLCSRARVNSHRLRNGTIANDDRRKLVEIAGEISQAPLFVDDSPSRNMTEIAATARRLKRKNNLGLIVIDYLQLVEPDNSRDPRQEQVAQHRPPAERDGARARGARIVLGAVESASGSGEGKPPPVEPPARVGRHRAGRRRGDVRPSRRILRDQQGRKVRRGG